MWKCAHSWRVNVPWCGICTITEGSWDTYPIKTDGVGIRTIDTPSRRSAGRQTTRILGGNSFGKKLCYYTENSGNPTGDNKWSKIHDCNQFYKETEFMDRILYVMKLTPNKQNIWSGKEFSEWLLDAHNIAHYNYAFILFLRHTWPCTTALRWY
jgi:hypothetical protein